MTAQPARPTYWDYDETAAVRCGRCGWSGVTTGESTDTFLDVRCPECDGPIAKIPWPTREDTHAAAAAGDARAQKELGRVDEIEARQAAAERIALRDAAQLPTIDDDRIEIAWDMVDDAGEHWTVLRHGERELFRELAYWEGIDRFLEVAAILRGAYGPRLRAIVPTRGSEMYLYGDVLGAPSSVERLNEELGRGAG
ncbi:hypothetical protein [Patulibacter sp.]|uniref:hypothetical protein n=1 Tax=Patulibacter sp. TaxID=1912859 RepID=UPI002724510A|nr:hypothetical protein [Patulibacter sp.]MDO9410065.1 hypothetical protein [Patulibacter sp.]